MRVLPLINTLQVSGSIERVDLVNREVELLVDMRRMGVDVPPNCVVLLRGEPVKLRILQPGDYVQVAFEARAGGKVARRIEVRGRQPI